MRELAAIVVVSCGLSACGPGSDSPATDASRIDAREPIDATSPDARLLDANRVFVTRGTSMKFGSLSNADTFCMSEAAARGYPGEFRAFLSTKAVPARDRIAGSRGWMRDDGMPVVDTVADLVAGKILYPIEVRLYGGEPIVATGSLPNGSAHEDNCNDFTSDSNDFSVWDGHPHAGTRQWTTSSWGTGCGAKRSIYCFEIGKSVDVSPPPIDGRLAFTTAELFAAGLGIASADALCQMEADNANRPGTFKALLATASASATSRFSDGLPWVRPDGVQITSTAMRLLEEGRFDAPVNVTISGAYTNGYAWLGANEIDQVGDQTCGDWRLTTQDGDVMYVETGRPDSPFLFGQPCITPNRLVCLQE